MAMDFQVHNINYAVSEGGLANVCKEVELVMSKSKTVTVPTYEITPAVPAVTETRIITLAGTRIKTPAVDAVEAVSAVAAVTGQRQVHELTQEEVTTTETVIVKKGSKWVQKEVTTTVTEDRYIAQYKEVDLWDAEGKKKIGKHQEPVMESYVVSPTVSAISAVSAVAEVTEEVAEVTEEVERTPAVPAVTSTSKTFTSNITESVELDAPDSDDFTAYADITEEIAIDWAKAKLGADELAAVEANLDAQIASQESPPVPTDGSGIPW